MKCPYKVKVCTKCKKILIVCEINFHKGKNEKYGFKSRCKKCREQDHKKYYKENQKTIKEYREKTRSWQIEYNRKYYKNNKEEILKKNKQYKEKNPHIYANAHNKRRKKKEVQGRGITKEQWYEMFCFFDFCCAYSGEYLGGDNTDRHRTVDHIIALDNGGLNEPWNCVPMYGNYNKQKQTKNMEEWYQEQEYYSEERLNKIYAWCEYAWSKWGCKKRRKGNRNKK